MISSHLRKQESKLGEYNVGTLLGRTLLSYTTIKRTADSKLLSYLVAGLDMLNRSVAAPSHGQNHLLFRDRQRNQQEGREFFFFSVNCRQYKNPWSKQWSSFQHISNKPSMLDTKYIQWVQMQFQDYTWNAVHMDPVQKRSSTQIVRGDHDCSDCWSNSPALKKGWES